MRYEAAASARAVFGPQKLDAMPAIAIMSRYRGSGKDRLVAVPRISTDQVGQHHGGADRFRRAVTWCQRVALWGDNRHSPFQRGPKYRCEYLVSLNDAVGNSRRHQMQTTFDFVIVGGGSAAAVIAARFQRILRAAIARPTQS
jgi:hypothetical protein